MSSLGLAQQPIRPFNVLAFDPGGTTGWALASFDWGNVGIQEEMGLEHIILTTGQFGPKEHHQELYEFIRQVQPKDVVSEPFHYRQNVVEEGGKFRGKVELISAEYIGVIRLACAQLGLSYYDRFTPGEAKTWTTDLKLQKLGWFQTPAHPKRHQNDALRQLVKYLIVKRGIKHPLTTAWRN